MSDTTPSPQDPDVTPTQAVPVAEQPAAAAAAPPAPAAPAAAPRTGGGHTRTILEVIGGVVAAGLIVVAGAVGFAVGHATAEDDGRWSMTRSGDGWHQGPDAGGPMGDRGLGDRGERAGPGQGQGQQGRDGGRGFGDRGQGQQGLGPGQGLGRGGPAEGPAEQLPAPQASPEASTSSFAG